MTRWAERAKAAISQTGLSVTVKTDERVEPSLLSVSSVSSVTVPADVEKKADLNYVQIPTKISRATYDGDPLLEELLDLGNQICNYWGDSEAARDQMRLDILSYSPDQRGGLLATLKGSLRANKPRGSQDGFTSAVTSAKF